MNPTKTNGFTEDWKNTKLEEASLEVSTWRFREQIARSKKTPALQATCTLEEPYCFVAVVVVVVFFFVMYIAGLHLVPNVLDLIAEKISEVGEYSL